MSWRDRLPPTRGRLVLDAPLAPYTWLRVGGPAEVLFLPRDIEDLQGFLAGLDGGTPVTVLGAGSNVLVRDGGVEGVVIRLGAAFAGVSLEGDELKVGAAALDAAVARAAAHAGIAGLEFLTGVPGSIGGALTMNAGCYGGETCEVVRSVEAVTRKGERLSLSAAEMGFSYRRSAAAEGLIFTGARLSGPPGHPETLAARMQEISEKRAAAQPLKAKTGGSTFKNPMGADGRPASAWRLIDAAGCRGVERGGAMMSPQHANFMINLGEASAEALEALGEWVRAKVREACGVELEWEIRRLGRPAALAAQALERAAQADEIDGTGPDPHR